jgi:hypothetical protein
MFFRVGCSIFFLTSVVLAQHTLMPGTVASSVGPDSDSDAEASSSSVNPARSSSSDEYHPITAKERVQWVLRGTFGPASLAAQTIGAGWGTLENSPKVYGTHWEGFGDRYGIGLSGLAVQNTLEAGIGAAWGEDPRYKRDEGASFGHRVGHVVRMTFMAEDRNGGEMLAYARFIAIPGGNFVSNAWRGPGDDNVDRAMVRTGLGFLGKMGNNTWDEFWPDLRQKLFHHGSN